ncbi:MHYT domain-containing protein [Streptomyces sp. V2I9]|uniref:MHYT domain-containing protein n=1 Tax=unclassified Streptomyces TaxID=2593676 RepID=UPI0027840CCB|nr:MHYT domain-containing protein [Streptomyces sp. V2I9]MDQ0983850.1 NO-binding membrane sensor protein with MHYT domain [Streptomyces sp. V2I9]
MQGTVDGFTYGLVTPVAAFLMAALGAALGLRCTTRSLRTTRGRRAGWLALGSLSIGSGVWTMHFVAMTGFTVRETPISYDKPLTFAGLAVAVVMIGIGIFIVGYRGATRMALITGGTITGLGIASMHYLGMAGMRMDARFAYDTPLVALSVLIAGCAATGALWAAVTLRGALSGLGASILMAVAVTGMHYTGMAALDVHLHLPPTLPSDLADVLPGDRPAEIIGPMLVGPGCFLLLAAVVLLFDPGAVTGEPAGRDPRAGWPSGPAPAPHQRRPGRSTVRDEALRTVRENARRLVREDAGSARRR